MGSMKVIGHKWKHLLQHALVTGNNTMAFNLALFESDSSVNEYTADVEAEVLYPFHFDWEERDDDFDLPDECKNNNEVVEHKWKPCSSNVFDYEFGNVCEAHWYKKFLCES